MRRMKSYSAQSGYVYQYFYEGFRAVSGGAEYVFETSADRKTSFPVAVIVEDDAVAAWTAAHGRELTGTERYAVAKMALFQAFDEREDPAQMRHPVRVRPADAAAILEQLGV